MCGLVYIYFDSLGTVLEINIDDDKDTQLYMEYIRNANHISHEVCKDSQQWILLDWILSNLGYMDHYYVQ